MAMVETTGADTKSGNGVAETIEVRSPATGEIIGRAPVTPASRRRRLVDVLVEES